MLLGAAEVFEPVDTEVFKPCALRERVGEQGGGRGRKHDLATVSGRRDTGSAVNIETDKAGNRPGCLTGVDSHPHADGFAGWPRMRNKRPLHLDSSGNAGARRRKYGEERIALGVDLLTVMDGQGFPDKPMMVGEDLRIRITQALKHRGRALDVSKEEGERLRGQWCGFPQGWC